jgi:hypothetical protein
VGLIRTQKVGIKYKKPFVSSVLGLETLISEILEMPANCGFADLCSVSSSPFAQSKSPIVSGEYLKYSRFWETATGDGSICTA